MKTEELIALGLTQEQANSVFATASAFIQQRQKFNEFALPALFDLFVKKTDDKKLYKGYRLLAADGSDVQVATNPNEPNSYFEWVNGQKPYSLLHLNGGRDAHKEDNAPLGHIGVLKQGCGQNKAAQFKELLLGAVTVQGVSHTY